MSRCGFAFLVSFACLTMSMTGCSDAWNAGPMQYVENETLTNDVKGKANIAGKPELQNKVRKALASLFGDSPQHIRVPQGSGLPAGGSTSPITFKRARAPTPSFTPFTKILPPANR